MYPHVTTFVFFITGIFPRVRKKKKKIKMISNDFLKIDAVKSYLRNFQSEKNQWNELLGITLCYGILCLSRNYTVQSMSVNEVREITRKFFFFFAFFC